MQLASERGGRPTTYNYERAAEIIERIAQGETLTDICRDEHMPGRMMCYWWMRKYPGFRDAINYARALQGESWGEKAVNEVMRDDLDDKTKVMLA